MTQGISFNLVSSITVRNLHMTNMVSGLLGTFVSHSTFQDIVSEAMSSVGVALVSSSFNSFKNVISASAGSRGLKFSGKSNRNVFHGLAVSGCQGYGVEFAGFGDSNNQLYAAVLHNNAPGPVLYGAGAVANYIDGDVQGTPTNNAISQAGFSPAGFDANAGNLARQTVSGNNGFVATSVHNATVSSTDFPAGRFLVFSAQGTAFLNFQVNLLGSDGTVRKSITSFS